MTVRRRNVAITRHWQLLLMLRQAARTIDQLASELRVTTRTIRRDLDCLRSVGFPIEQRTPDGESSLWALTTMSEWPRREVVPVAGLDPHQAMIRQVLSMDCDGLTADEVAGRLHVSADYALRLMCDAYR